MPFPFVYVCDLLDDLDRLHIRHNPLLPRDLHQRTTSTANQWLKNHKFDLNAFDTQEGAVLWILRPDKLVDRHYGIDIHRLESIIARVYQLPGTEYAKLQSWKTTPHVGDLGACVHLVRDAMRVPSPRKEDTVTVEEIQSTLLRVASLNSQSSPAVRSISKHFPDVDIIQSLGSIYERLHGREAMWLTRYILKDYRAIMLPDSWEMEAGRLGMPNVASITLNMFTKPPPIPVMIDGTRVVKAMVPTVMKGRPVRPTVQLSENGWPRRPAFRSRESSPISQPLLFARGILRPQAALTPVSVAEKASTSIVIPPRQTSTFDVFSEARPGDENGGVSVVRPASQASFNAQRSCAGSSNIDAENIPMTVSSTATTLVLSTPSQNAQRPCPSPTMVTSSHEFEPVLSSLRTLVPTSSDKDAPTSSHRKALSTLSSNISNIHPPSPGRSPKNTSPEKLLRTGGTGICRISSSESPCSLTRCIFILSPCVASNPRLVNELLPWHGSLYTTSHISRNNPSFPNYCPKTRLRYRKIILINTHNRTQTVGFLKAVQDLDLQMKVMQGKRKRNREEVWTKEWLEVYDWRILEAVAKIDQGKKYEYDVWKRNFIGTI